MMAYTELMAALGVLDADECARLLQTLAESGEWDAEYHAFVTEEPEPSTCTLMLAGVGFAARRRRAP